MSPKQRQWRQTTTVGLGTLVVVVLLAVLGNVRSVGAGPVTNPYNAPFVRLGVYQGVIRVVPSGGANVLAIGEAGREIAGSGDLYLRPGGLVASAGVKLAKSTTFAETAISLQGGRVCLDPAQNGVWDCQSIWPTGGGPGDTLWTRAGTVLSPVSIPAPNDIDTIQVGTSNLVRACRGGNAPTAPDVSCTTNATCAAAYSVCRGGTVPVGNNTPCSTDQECLDANFGPLSYCALSSCEILGDAAVNGTALTVATNLPSPALTTTGGFISGYNTDTTGFYPNIYTGGDVKITNGRLIINNSARIYLYEPYGFLSPWTQQDVFYDSTKTSPWNSSTYGIDADTFDGSSNLGLLQSDHNVFVKIPPAYRYSSCSGGPNSGNACGTNADCPTYNAVCTLILYCVDGPNIGNRCSGQGVNANDCGAGFNCGYNGVCGSGPNVGAACTSANRTAVCGSAVTCDRTDQKICLGGDRFKSACTDNAECPGSTCGFPSACTGFCSQNDQISCQSDADCGAGNFCNKTNGNYGKTCNSSSQCPLASASCVDHPYPALCISAQTSTGRLCTVGTEIGKPCSTDANCAGSAVVGRCALMCGGVQSTCTQSATGKSYASPPTIPTPNLTCSNFHKRYTNFCRGGSAPTGAASVLCETNEQCINSFGPLSTCKAPTCEDKCSTPFGYWCSGNHMIGCPSGGPSGDSVCAAAGAGTCVVNDPNGSNVPQNGIWNRYCTSDSQCDTTSVGGPAFRCGMTLCEGHGTCRLLGNSGKPGGRYGWCFNDVSCGKNSDCNVKNAAGAIVENGACTSMGFCSGVNLYDSQKTCVGGVRGPSTVRNPGHCVGGSTPGAACKPNVDICAGGGICTADTITCSSRNTCVGGSQDSKTADAGVCAAGGGVIGNAFDYCPDSGMTCKPTTSCAYQSECGYDQICALGEPHPFNQSSDDYWCDIACKQYPINRCRGATTISGAPANSCSTYGQDPTYKNGNSSLANGSAPPIFPYVCDCTTTQFTYAAASTSSADLCTVPLH